MSPQGSDPCHCGSGLLFRRCHGSVIDPETGVGNVPIEAQDAVVSLVGFPGTHQTMHLLNRFKEGDPRNALPKQGAPGFYEVTFVLRRPGYSLHAEGKITFAAGLQGDSHLAISKPAFSPPGHPDADQILIMGNTEDGHFTFIGHSNSNGFLGKLVSSPFHANSRQHAEEIAYRAISSSLSDFSLHLDIPLDIATVETKDMSTGSIQISFRSPYRPAPFAINPTSTLLPEYRNYTSLYREAMNTNSPVFEFLCMFKIIEALRWRRRRLEKNAKRSGLPYSPRIERLPATNAEIVNWLRTIFAAWHELDLATLESAVPANLRGHEFNHVIDKVLKPLRDNVAHALASDTGELTISSDDLLGTHRITSRLLLTKCIARRMLKTEFSSDFLGYILDPS